MKVEFLQLFIDNPNLTFEQWNEVTKRSKRSYYDYQKASKADATTKVVPHSKLEQVTKELDTLLTERDAWDKERADLLRAVEELPYENQQLEIENKELRGKVEKLQLSNENLYSQLHDSTKAHKQELAQVQAERDFLQLCEDEERERKEAFGHKSVWFLVILILITSFKNVWNGFDGVETDTLSSFMFSLIFAIAGFCIMQITNVARKLQLAISAICIAWECAFCASTLFSNMYKIAQVQETFAQAQKVQVAPIVQQISNYFDTDQQNTAFVVAWLLSISVSIILYTSIYLLTAKNK